MRAFASCIGCLAAAIVGGCGVSQDALVPGTAEVPLSVNDGEGKPLWSYDNQSEITVSLKALPAQYGSFGNTLLGSDRRRGWTELEPGESIVFRPSEAVHRPSMPQHLIVRTQASSYGIPAYERYEVGGEAPYRVFVIASATSPTGVDVEVYGRMGEPARLTLVPRSVWPSDLAE